ncbi:hypothetical protein EDC56_3679 [Sinobacterium caligoides]|uniref:Uncharacterized protein n=1 Tax=Sinobacterium caligoides TaxID=933926 RepID=A0A3N2DEC9_9GAMM|nr:hypothetical protein [Sinobacterium caligoides]ROR98008.1 hypothetical protein EDC56_3679 [Sinobacterium caligoides]
MSNLNKGSESPFICSNLFYSICAITGLPGIAILAWCGFYKGSPFPYATYIGIGLVVFCTIFSVFVDKAGWVKGRHHYSDDLGGNRGGAD